MIRETVSSACQLVAAASDLPPDVLDHVSLEELVATLGVVRLLQELERAPDVFFGQADRRRLDLATAGHGVGDRSTQAWAQTMTKAKGDGMSCKMRSPTYATCAGKYQGHMLRCAPLSRLVELPSDVVLCRLPVGEQLERRGVVPRTELVCSNPSGCVPHHSPSMCRSWTRVVIAMLRFGGSQVERSASVFASASEGHSRFRVWSPDRASSHSHEAQNPGHPILLN